MKPFIAIPIGDVAGVGPEITVKSLAKKEVFDAARAVVVGDKKIMEKAIKVCGADLKINVINEPEEGVYEENILNLIDLDNIDMSSFEYGKVQAMCGKAAFEYIKKSIELANARKVDAVAPTPIHKEA